MISVSLLITLGLSGALQMPPGLKTLRLRASRLPRAGATNRRRSPPRHYAKPPRASRSRASSRPRRAVFIADLSVQAPPSVFDTRRPGINELAYSKDGTLAVAAGPGTAGEVFLFD